ncbi:MAG: hypothetical protein JWO97_2356 [Acidobacteria bacterium]|nr:hypothetical protein [Acidobacteriota bacterium]
MFESIYSDADASRSAVDATRRTIQARLRQTTVINRYAPLPAAVIAASPAPLEAARIVEAAIAKSQTAIDPARFLIPLQRSRLLFVAGRISASVAGSNIYLKIEASPVLWLAVFVVISIVAMLAMRGWTATAVACALAITVSLAFAREAAFRLLERIALSLIAGGTDEDACPSTD